jgi:hypothetical protein
MRAMTPVGVRGDRADRAGHGEHQRHQLEALRLRDLMEACERGACVVGDGLLAQQTQNMNRSEFRQHIHWSVARPIFTGRTSRVLACVCFALRLALRRTAARTAPGASPGRRTVDGEVRTDVVVEDLLAPQDQPARCLRCGRRGWCVGPSETMHAAHMAGSVANARGSRGHAKS